MAAHTSGDALPTQWSTILSSKVNLPHIINFRAICAANLVTKHPRFGCGRTWRHTPPETPCPYGGVRSFDQKLTCRSETQGRAMFPKKVLELFHTVEYDPFIKSLVIKSPKVARARVDMAAHTSGDALPIRRWAGFHFQKSWFIHLASFKITTRFL